MNSPSENPLRNLIREIHRRSLWQVLGIYVVGGWIAFEVVQTLTEGLGLPEWFPSFAIVLLIIGLPIVMATAFVQEGGPGRDSVESPPHEVQERRSSHQLFTWRNAILGGVGAFALWGVVAAGWLILGNGLDQPSVSASEVLEAGVQIQQAAEGGRMIEAFNMARNLPEEVPDSVQERILSSVSFQDTLTSTPTGVRVSWRPFGEPRQEWEYIGVTPLAWHFPLAPIAIRLELDGYTERTVGLSGGTGDDWELRRVDGPLPNGLHVAGGALDFRALDPSLSVSPSVEVGSFVIDRYEVTNRQYQEFIDAGGYQRQEFWAHSFQRNGETVEWEQALAEFTDRTGRAGPSTWEFGRFPEGMEDYPVTGISWYEAAAYAEFVGRELPTLFHWYRAAVTQASADIVPLSNLQGDGLTAVGEFPGITPVGASDMAGNAREWVWNATSEGVRYTAGGGWDDPYYAFSLAQPQPAFDRSPTNGFRLISELGPSDVVGELRQPVERFSRDFDLESPVSDDAFSVFEDLYAYEAVPLNAVVEAVDTLEFAVRERISMDSPYGRERMALYLFLPKDQQGPLQTVVYFPGSGALDQSSIERWSGESGHPAFLVRSGRAVAFPVYKSTFDREDEFVYRLQDTSDSYRDHVLQWRQDLGRSIDYLETRPVLDADRLAYFGFSWGGRMGAIMLAVEPRFQTGVLYLAGLSPKPTQRVVDPFHFAPRIDIPILMLSGQYDWIYPLGTSARPLFDLIGSEDKVHYVAEGGHYVPRDQLMRETTAWLDEHLGPVR